MKAIILSLIVGLSLSFNPIKAQSLLIDLTNSKPTELLSAEQISNIFFQGESSLLKIDTLAEALVYSFKVKGETLIVVATGPSVDRASSIGVNCVYALIFLENTEMVSESIPIGVGSPEDIARWSSNLKSTTDVNPQTVIFTRKGNYCLRTKDGEPLLIYGLYNPKALKG